MSQFKDLVNFMFNERNETMAKKIFISFAIEDATYRNLLKGQSLNTDTANLLSFRKHDFWMRPLH